MILFISDPRDDYQDSVFYAFRKTYGDEVVTFPRKPGFYEPEDRKEHFRNSYYNFKDCNISIEDIIGAKIKAVFIISSGYPIHDQAKEILEKILAKNPKSWPLIVIDGADQSGFQHNAEMENYPCKYDLYFKREMLDFEVYDPRIKPLPFSIIPEKFPTRRPVDKDFPVFFRGFTTAPDRPFFAKDLGLSFPGSIIDCNWHAPVHMQDREEYFGLIDRSKINLNIIGTGYDCIRLWEVLGCGGFVMSQKMPQIVEPPFEDGKHLVYFSSKKEMIDKMNFYMKNNALRGKIAIEGHEFAMKNHTCFNRMNYILEEIKKLNFNIGD